MDDEPRLKRIECWHATKLHRLLWPTYHFLYALKRRCEKFGLAPDNRLRRSVEATYDSMNSLMTELHYLSIPHGVGESHEDTTQERG